MDARELRIGNLVSEINEDSIGTIAAILQSERNIFDVEILSKEGMFFEVQLEDLRPIPLTEEWLIKMGFEIDTEEENDYFHNGNGYFFGMRKSVDSWNYFHSYYEIFSKEIKYVHQLQNLFYAINQYELTIKE